MILREATEKDLPVLLTMEQGVVEAERPFNDLIRETDARYYDLNDLINSSNACMIVGEIDGEIVATGYSQIRVSKASVIHERHGYLGFMFVLPEHRGQGLNKKVLNHLLAWSKDQGVNHIYLDVYSENEPAIRAYEKAGFKPSLLEMKLSL